MQYYWRQIYLSLILLNVQDYYQQVVKGLVLLLAVGIDRYSKKPRLRTVSPSK